VGYLDRLPEIREQLRRSRELVAKVKDGTATEEERAQWQRNVDVGTAQLQSVYEREVPAVEPVDGSPTRDKPTTQALVDLGLTFQPHTYENTQDDDEALYLLLAWLVEMHEQTGGTGNYQAFWRDAQGPFGGPLYTFCGKWAHFAFNSVRYDARYCASLLCTSLSSEVLDEIDMPWPAFLIEVPAGLIPVKRADDKPDHVERLLVDKWIGQWRYLAITHAGGMLSKHHRTAQQLVGGRIDPAALDGAVFGTLGAFGQDVDKRMHELLGRLVVNTCLALTDPTTHRVWAPIDPKRRMYASPHRKGMPPQVRIYELRKPVKIDCRPIVTEYLSSGQGSGKRLTVQLYVGSYWRRQAHGPGRSLRRWQQIEGHWKGPVDAPIAVRPHALGTGGCGP
jgi:hypothetical protein